jgi:hypothetical protein
VWVVTRPESMGLRHRHASADELKALPGIGDAYAKKIDGQPRRDEILKKAGAPRATYDEMKDPITRSPDLPAGAAPAGW